MTGKPPPHFEISGDEKWSKLDLMDGIPLNARIMVKDNMAPLTLKIGYEKFFFKGLKNMKDFAEVSLKIWASFKHRRPD